MSNDQIALVLQRIGYYSVILWPHISQSSVVIVSAVFPIIAGAHASLKCPSSARKPARGKEPGQRDDEDDDDEDGTGEAIKMEKLGPMDALLLPLFAGMTLTGLYFLIKWLDDPELISKLLNWYFTIFDVISLSKFLGDALRTAHDLAFPRAYTSRGSTWTRKKHERAFTQTGRGSQRTDSPLPGMLSAVWLPWPLKTFFWWLRDLRQDRIYLGIFIKNVVKVHDTITLFPLLGFVLSISLQAYKIIVGTPWMLNNLSAFGFAYTVLQVLSPSTALTATAILGALFVYDIYFVFFTPVMVKVATSLDIPAKLVFPRKDGFGMLGLGDIVLPGMVIGWALRLDLWLHYFAQQSRTKRVKSKSAAKPEFVRATGDWGARFWTSHLTSSTTSLPLLKGVVFSKPYFSATIAGYILGMILTFAVMTLANHAQPALLYLVPTVIGSLWLTAAVRGEIGLLLEYTEEEDDGKEKGKDKERDKAADAQEKADSKEDETVSKPWTVLSKLFGDALNADESSRPPSSSDSKKRSRSTAKSKDGRSDKKDGALFSVSVIYPAPAVAKKVKVVEDEAVSE